MKVIETERLILREWKDEDTEQFILMNQDPKVMEHFPKMLSPDETLGLLGHIKDHIKEYGFGLWAATIKDTGEWIGFIGICHFSLPAHFSPCVEVGWRLKAECWGNGYAPEGARAALAYGFEKLGLEEIVAFTVPTNDRSMRVMEKIGMTRNIEDDFAHPKLPADHKLSHHCLYRIKNPKIPSGK